LLLPVLLPRLAAYSAVGISLPVSLLGSSVPLVTDDIPRGTVGGEAGVSAQLRLADGVAACANFDVWLRYHSTTQTGNIGLRMT